jgi:hypothetical protein
MGFNSSFRGLNLIKSLNKFIPTRLNPLQFVLRKLLISLHRIKKKSILLRLITAALRQAFGLCVCGNTAVRGNYGLQRKRELGT